MGVVLPSFYFGGGGWGWNLLPCRSVPFSSFRCGCISVAGQDPLCLDKVTPFPSVYRTIGCGDIVASRCVLLVGDDSRSLGFISPDMYCIFFLQCWEWFSSLIVVCFLSLLHLYDLRVHGFCAEKFGLQITCCNW